ncbi:MAG: GDSL-type esterase/lipase family protein [Verrucomicrobiota bacterium]|nr:GDSL-type esterase/lipase family protein [Verrucomicrobiota bacterium]
MRKNWLALLFLFFFCVQVRAEIKFNEGDRVLLYGTSFIERMQQNGFFEAAVQLANPGMGIELRSLAWTGDELGYRLRPERYVNHLKKLLDKWPADYVILGFGLYESFAGPSGIESFKADLNGYLDEMKRRHPEAGIILLSPIATENLNHPHYPDPAQRNGEIKSYVDAMSTIAESRKIQFIDLFDFSKSQYASHKRSLTDNGVHLNSYGHELIAGHLSRNILGDQAYDGINKERIGSVARAVSRKAQYVSTVVRPVNTVLYFGVRGRANEYNAEIPRYHELIKRSDERIHAMVRDRTLNFNSSPLTLDPLFEREPAKLPSPEQMLKSFKVADGYKVNLFASEKEFPELRNPEQIAFDSLGRLWVVTMPSFPGTIPGDVPQDKVIILEDTNRDGRADKSTVFADHLTVPDGLAFHEDGVIISHQPRLVFMKDSDGDGRADYQKEMLRGIDVTDAHHGGMIAMSPLGHVMFCDGVFHRSQLETPYGITRGVDATTYRFDLRKGTVEREYQTLTPNPWKITWDRWGNLFQMYGDGFVQDSNAIPWTPFGVYHPFKRAISIAYGKGSAACVISSPNFPEEYQQGMASAVLLRKCFVSISKHTAGGAYYKARDRLDVLSSPDPIFRPVDIAFGLDGAMYVSDFCTRIIGHAQNSMRDPRWDPYTGRVWRIVHKSKPTVRDWPKIEGASVQQLLELLKHPQNIVRDHARRKLRSVDGIVPELDRWLGDELSDANVLEGLWVLHDQGQVRENHLKRLFSSPDQRIRAAATSLIRFQESNLKDPVSLLKRMASDPHPRVRTEVIHTVSYLQQKDQGYASILGQVNVSDDQGLRTILEDAGHGTASGHGPEVPVLSRPEDSKLKSWLLSAGNKKERYFVFGGSAGKGGSMRTFVGSPSARRATLSIKHSYVKVFLNGVPVIASANWWSSDWNVQVDLVEGLNQIEVQYVSGRGAQGHTPVYLFDPLGRKFTDLEVPGTENKINMMAAAYKKDNGQDDDSIRVSAVPNELAFSPSEIRLRAGKKIILTFDNPDLQIHNLVIVKPGSGERVGQLADQMAQDPDALERQFVPDSNDVIWSTSLVNGKGTFQGEFNVPKVPGRYPFICSFPGHWRVMKGVMVVYE